MGLSRRETTCCDRSCSATYAGTVCTERPAARPPATLASQARTWGAAPSAPLRSIQSASACVRNSSSSASWGFLSERIFGVNRRELLEISCKWSPSGRQARDAASSLSRRGRRTARSPSGPPRPHARARRLHRRRHVPAAQGTNGRAEERAADEAKGSARSARSGARNADPASPDLLDQLPVSDEPLIRTGSRAQEAVRIVPPAGPLRQGCELRRLAGWPSGRRHWTNCRPIHTHSSRRKRTIQDGGRSLSGWCPRQDSNLRTTLRRRVLYPLSYGGPGQENFIARR